MNYGEDCYEIIAAYIIVTPIYFNRRESEICKYAEELSVIFIGRTEKEISRGRFAPKKMT